MKSSWFEGARTPEAKEERKLWIISGANAFKVLTGMLEARIQAKETERNLERNYNLPAYSEYQADTSGYIRALREVQSLLDIGNTNG